MSLSPAPGRVVVTGAGSGIGRATAIALAQQGKTVYALGRRADALAETSTASQSPPGQIVPIVCDVTDEDAVRAAFDRIKLDGPASGLVHAAAQITKMPAREMTPTHFREVVSSTLFGAFIVLREWAEPLLDSNAAGSAVMLTSNSASRGTPGVSHSSAGKAGVESLVQSLAREWGPYGIRLNAVGPGAFPVEKSQKMWTSASVHQRMLNAIALSRFGELHEIVAPILFFLGDGATYITGQTLRVDGGLSLTRWSVEPDELAAGVNNQYGASLQDV